MHRAEREVHLSEQYGTSGQEVEYWGVVVQARTTANLSVVDPTIVERVLRRSAWCARRGITDLLCVCFCCTSPTRLSDSTPRDATCVKGVTEAELTPRFARGGAMRTATGARVTRRPALRRRARGARPKAAMS